MSPQKRYNQRIRSLAIFNLGGACENCSSTSNLEIHHIFGDGRKERQKGHTRAHVLRASKGDTYGLQCLCHDCHVKETHKIYLTKTLPETLYLDVRFMEQIALD